MNFLPYLIFYALRNSPCNAWLLFFHPWRIKHLEFMFEMVLMMVQVRIFFVWRDLLHRKTFFLSTLRLQRFLLLSLSTILPIVSKIQIVMEKHVANLVMKMPSLDIVIQI